MTTKKLIIIIGSVLAAIVLLIVLFAGAIIGIVFYSIGQSDAAEASKKFLKENEKLRQDIGNVTDFGTFITGSVNSSSDGGVATLYLKVIGERSTVHTRVDSIYRNGKAWRVTGASYENAAGQTIKLLEPYDSTATEP